MKLPRKLKKKVKKESLKQQRIKQALEAIGKACAAVIFAMQVYKIQATKPKFPPGGITYSGDEYLFKL